ncbi:NAD-specific glutamate dehydrogenase [mine drainage metagenome]|uniref:NAD-specific glutamate dehydrogenase n=1 Tax=mine drainage metagenome TaxID=410659 RepID=A0A1J5QU77_9ZZZZ
MAEGIACYRLFLSGMLDLTDNLVKNNVVPPASVVRHDGDDPYLVVAADKGTASFSDIANSVSADYGFWLGDAFASGGSVGYDHKKMGITARGAWESTKRHFRALGINTQTTAFKVVGIGDMSGDVFGNGMLLSEHIQLVAAFDHRHIFIDPTPDVARSFAERKRLFALPRSSWDDYDRSLISQGGAIYSRSAKSIRLTDAAQAIQTAYRAGPGSVIVQRVDHADGGRGWVVAIPGTQSMSLGAGSNPFDNRTNLAAMAGVADDSSALVAGALRSAGARAGEAVLLAGHSQGGMVAARLAGDPAFAATYRVRSVLTMGSPIGAMAVPATTQALAMENLSDSVPSIDGTPNPDAPNVTTVKRDLSASSDPRDVAAAGSLFGSHDLSVYLGTAAKADASDHPSITAWREAAAEVTGAPGDTVTTTVFQGTRVEPARAQVEQEVCRAGPVRPFPLGPLSPIVPRPFGPSSPTAPLAHVLPLATIPLAPTVPRLSGVGACPTPPC